MIDPTSLINYKFANFSDEDLRALSKKIEEESSRRRQEERNLLISNFKLSLHALHEANIRVIVERSCPDCGADVTVGLYDNFYFD